MLQDTGVHISLKVTQCFVLFFCFFCQFSALILILIKYSEFVWRGPQELEEKSWKHSCSEVNLQLITFLIAT